MTSTQCESNPTDSCPPSFASCPTPTLGSASTKSLQARISVRYPGYDGRGRASEQVDLSSLLSVQNSDSVDAKLVRARAIRYRCHPNSDSYIFVSRRCVGPLITTSCGWEQGVRGAEAVEAHAGDDLVSRLLTLRSFAMRWLNANVLGIYVIGRDLMTIMYPRRDHLPPGDPSSDVFDDIGGVAMMPSMA